MPDNDFALTQFRGLNLEEQISKCHLMAAEAEGFAAVNPDKRDQYLDLAARWSELAEEMQQALGARASPNEPESWFAKG